MIAVLVDSRRAGKTSWVATRGLKRVRVQGLVGSSVLIELLESAHVLAVSEDGEFALPAETDMVRVSHADATPECRVFVDLIGD